MGAPDILKDREEKEVETPYGRVSAVSLGWTSTAVWLCRVEGVLVVH